MYVAAAGNGRVRRIRPNGHVTTWAGPGRTVWPDGSTGIGSPFALALAPSGTLYVGAEWVEGRENVLYAITPAGTACKISHTSSRKISPSSIEPLPMPLLWASARRMRWMMSVTRAGG